GDWMLRLPALVAGGTLAGPVRVAIALAAGVGMLLCFAVATGFGWRADGGDAEDPLEEDDARGSISLGFITHGFLSLKARRARGARAGAGGGGERGPAARPDGAAFGGGRAGPAAAPDRPGGGRRGGREPASGAKATRDAAPAATVERRLCATLARIPRRAESDRTRRAERRRAADERHRARRRALRLRRARRDH